MSKNFPEQSIPDTITLKGQTFEVGVVVQDEEVIIFYDKEMETVADTHQAKLGALNGVKNRYEAQGKRVFFRAE